MAIIFATYSGTKKALRRRLKHLDRDKDYDVLEISNFHSVKNKPMLHTVRVKLDDKMSIQPRARPRIEFSKVA